MKVTITGGYCEACGTRLGGVYWHGNRDDDHRFPVEIERDEIRTVGACAHCGGNILLILAEARAS